MQTRKINLVVIHCSDSDFPHHDDIEIIKHWHVAERGWSDVGYHFVLTKDGGVHFGRPTEKSGAHVKNYNHSSIGICLTGRSVFSEKQIESCIRLCRILKNLYGLEAHDFLGHKELDKSKTCPNLDMQKIRVALVG